MSLKLMVYRRLCSIIYYSGLLSVFKALNRRKVRVLTYHRIDEVDADFVARNILNIAVPRPLFERQLDYLRKRYDVIPMARFVAALEGKAAWPENAVVLTLDDGTKDNYRNAFPALKERGLPATFFVVTNAAGGELPDYYTYYFVFDRLGAEKMLAALNQALGKEHREMFEARLEFLSLGKARRQEILAGLCREHGLKLPGGLCGKHFMDWNELSVLHKSGLDVEPHSASHALLSRVPAEEARTEIRVSKAAIERRLGKKCGVLAYPFGWERSWSPAIVGMLGDAGFQAAFLAVDGLNDENSGRFTLKRCNAVPNSLPEFACEVEGLRAEMNKIVKALLFFRVTLYNRKEAETRDLNERQKRALAYLEKNPAITSKKYAKIANIPSPPVAIADLNKLVHLGVIKRIGKTRGAYYILNQQP